MIIASVPLCMTEGLKKPQHFIEPLDILQVFPDNEALPNISDKMDNGRPNILTIISYVFPLLSFFAHF